MNDNYHLLLTCTRGFEAIVQNEAESLGCSNCEIIGGGVRVYANMTSVMRLCLWSRTVNKVMLELASAYIHKEDDFYILGHTLPLSPWFTAQTTFCIHAHVNDERFKNPVILSLKLKDGLVDLMRDKWGCRASVDTRRPDIELNLQVIQKKARVFLELQGEPLNMRGYRRRQNLAPIRETLAASMIALSGWTPDMAFTDPMCGSGTFAIEAALLATNTAPGIQRHFAFEKLPFFSAELKAEWGKMRDEAKECAKIGRKRFEGVIYASDIDPAALDIAANNAKTAGIDAFVRFECRDVLELKPTGGHIMMNPPYGERIRVSGYDLPEFYYQLGRHLRTFPGACLTIISTPELLKKNLHMKPDMRVSTFNGPITCEVARYALGSRG